MGETVKKVRVEFLEDAWALIERVAELDDRKPSSVLRELMRSMLDALKRGNTTLRLTPTWQEAYTQLQLVSATQEAEEDASIDLSMLHTSKVLGSGFEGVYAHPQGFTAQGRDPVTKKPGKYLGLFSTAVKAARARYDHYRAHGLPYGLLEEQIEKIRARPEWRGSEEQWLRAAAIHQLALKGKILPDLSDEDRRWEVENPASVAP